MTSSPIRFGTSGWRAIIADAFTFPNVRLVCRAIARTLTDSGLAARGVVVGYDTRFLSERFAAEAASVLAAEGIRCAVSATAIPTPAVAHAVRQGGFGGAVNITASHNPAEYNGLKLSTDKGAPSPPELTRAVEAQIAALVREAELAATPAAGAASAGAASAGAASTSAGAAASAGAASTASATAASTAAASRLIETGDFRDAYIAQIDSLVRFDIIKKAGVRLAVDPRWGAARGWYDEILRRHGIPFTLLHDGRDVTFGSEGPDVSERTLKDLSRAVVEQGCTLGVACDGDADRFGVVDADGTWINPNLLLALLADYLAETRGWRQGLGRTYATTGLIDAVARHYGVPVYQTPVGFKYLGEQILEGKVYLAGEESAGMSIIGHVPEKDGLLAGLLAAEMVAHRGRGIGRLKADLFAKVGPLHSAREDFQVTPEQTARLRAHMKSPPGALGGHVVRETTVLDGLRLDFADGAWLLMRPSGTEPVVRYYVEAPGEAELGDLMKAGKHVLIGGAA